MTEKVTSIWTRILAFTAALLSGLIFVLGSVSGVFFGQSFLDYALAIPGLDAVVAQILNVIILVANFIGFLVLIAAVLILIGGVRAAKIMLFICIGSGLIGFAIPVFLALSQGAISIEVILGGVGTKYLVATLFGLIAKLYADKL